MDLVSIIIPTYNTLSTYLKECIESCLQQSYTNLEILIIDDHSSNAETLALIEAYRQQDARIRVIYQDSNHGQAHNRNIAIAQCQGKYFTMIDHDDILLPDFIARSLKSLQKTGADFSMAYLLTFYDQDSHLTLDEKIKLHQARYQGRDKWNLFGKHESIVSLSGIVKNGILGYFPITVYGKLFDKQRYVDAKVCFDASAQMRNVEDTDWSLRVALALKNFVLLDFYGVMHRFSTTAASAESLSYLQNSISALVQRGKLVTEANVSAFYLNAAIRQSLDFARTICYKCQNQAQRNEQWQLICNKLAQIGYPLGPRQGDYDAQYTYNLTNLYKCVYPEAEKVLFVTRYNLYSPKLSTWKNCLATWAGQGLAMQCLHSTCGTSAQESAAFIKLMQQIAVNLSEEKKQDIFNKPIIVFQDNGLEHMVLKTQAFMEQQLFDTDLNEYLSSIFTGIVKQLVTMKQISYIMVAQDELATYELMQHCNLGNAKLLLVKPQERLSDIFATEPQLLAKLNCQVVYPHS